MYLLAGGTGQLGSRVAEKLRALDLPVRALVRPGSDAGALEAIGIEIARGDLRDPASLDEAMRGVDRVVTTANSMGRQLAGDPSLSFAEVDVAGNANLVDAAVRAAVDRFVFVSMVRDVLGAGTPFTDAKRLTETRLAAAPMKSVIVRPEAFMEVWLSPLVGVDLARGTMRVFGQGRSRHPYVSVEDVASAVVRLAVMDEPPAEAVLAGPEAVSLEEIAGLWTSLTGAPVKISHVPRPMLAVGSRILRPVKPAIASSMGMALQEDSADGTGSAEMLRALGIEPRSVQDHLRDLKGVAVPA